MAQHQDKGPGPARRGSESVSLSSTLAPWPNAPVGPQSLRKRQKGMTIFRSQIGSQLRAAGLWVAATYLILGAYRYGERPASKFRVAQLVLTDRRDLRSSASSEHPLLTTLVLGTMQSRGACAQPRPP